METLWGVGSGGYWRLGVPGGIPLKVRAKTKSRRNYHFLPFF